MLFYTVLDHIIYCIILYYTILYYTLVSRGDRPAPPFGRGVWGATPPPGQHELYRQPYDICLLESVFYSWGVNLAPNVTLAPLTSAQDSLPPPSANVILTPLTGAQDSF